MKIKILIAFNDSEAKEGGDPYVPVGSEITVAASRGEYLIGLGLAEPVPEKSTGRSQDTTNT